MNFKILLEILKLTNLVKIAKILIILAIRTKLCLGISKKKEEILEINVVLKEDKLEITLMKKILSQESCRFQKEPQRVKNDKNGSSYF